MGTTLSTLCLFVHCARCGGDTLNVHRSYYTVYMCRVTYFSISPEQREKYDETTPLQRRTEQSAGKQDSMYGTAVLIQWYYVNVCLIGLIMDTEGIRERAFSEFGPILLKSLTSEI